MQELISNVEQARKTVKEFNYFKISVGTTRFVKVTIGDTSYTSINFRTKEWTEYETENLFVESLVSEMEKEKKRMEGLGTMLFEMEKE